MCWEYFHGRSVEVLDFVFIDQPPLLVDRLVTPSLPTTARAALLLHDKPAYLPHHLKAKPIKHSARVADPKIVDPSHDDGTNPF